MYVNMYMCMYTYMCMLVCVYIITFDVKEKATLNVTLLAPWVLCEGQDFFWWMCKRCAILNNYVGRWGRNTCHVVSASEKPSRFFFCGCAKSAPFRIITSEILTKLSFQRSHGGNRPKCRNEHNICISVRSECSQCPRDCEMFRCALCWILMNDQTAYSRSAQADTGVLMALEAILYRL